MTVCLKAARFLNPQADVVFKKVFGEHPHILKRFLNVMIPLPRGVYIERLEYLPIEQAPKIVGLKRPVVDVKCFDQIGRIFIVEMQIEWVDSFFKRITYNTSNAYVKQLAAGNIYDNLSPVYALSLTNDNIYSKYADYYHVFRMQHEKYPELTINEVTYIFVELQKYAASQDVSEEERRLWLQYITAANELKEIPDVFKGYPELEEALALTQESAYTLAELNAYDDYWDGVATQRTLEHHREQERLKIERAKEEVTQLKEKVAQAQEEVAQAQEEVAQAQEEVAQAQEEVAQAQEEVAQAQEEVAQAQEEVAQARKEMLSQVKALEDRVKSIALIMLTQNIEPEVVAQQLELSLETVCALRDQIDKA